MFAKKEMYRAARIRKVSRYEGPTADCDLSARRVQAGAPLPQSSNSEKVRFASTSGVTSSASTSPRTLRNLPVPPVMAK